MPRTAHGFPSAGPVFTALIFCLHAFCPFRAPSRHNTLALPLRTLTQQASRMEWQPEKLRQKVMLLISEVNDADGLTARAITF